MGEKFNAGKALDAVIRRIEDRDGRRRDDGGLAPDETGEPDPGKRVDYVCTIGGRLHAFEHTGIEAFGDQIRTEARNGILYGPIIDRFDWRGREDELLSLHVPFAATAELRTSDFDRI